MQIVRLASERVSKSDKHVYSILYIDVVLFLLSRPKLIMRSDKYNTYATHAAIYVYNIYI